ncbi:MAG: RNA polymerase sigma factor [Saprospiraceae bacterium]|nr:RNA polymerase sigma factor [Saprospiraceae bacterium]MBP6447759.1 RNA polymerase sigma factor [Saprospiraceae bacterium]
MSEYSDNDQVILDGCRRNDRKSQEALYRKYFRKLFLMCYRYANDENKTSEIVNDAFLIIFKNIQKYEGKGSFEGWIRRITFNAIADHFRKEKRGIKFLFIDEAAHAGIADNTEYSDHMNYEYILKKVFTLQGHYKDVFVKYAIEGYNHKEIGEKLNISEGTSKWYLSEARKKLQLLINSSLSDIKYGR